MSPETPVFPVKAAQDKLTAVKQEIGKVIVGQSQLVDRLLIGLFANGHLLLEGVPGVAKTLAANTLAKIVNCDFKRIQFTPDLLPADLIGTSIYNPKESSFSVKKGPIFTQFLLADEINRSPAKVQSALLEVMQENQVTIAGETFKGPQPFFVIATQNPIELEGTYPLAEAQTDRFMMKVLIPYPSHDDEREIIKRMSINMPKLEVKPLLSVQEIILIRNYIDEVYLDEKVSEYLLNIIMATRNPKKMGVPIDGLIEYGASPRAGIALTRAAKAKTFIDGRSFVTPQDIKELAPDILRHRIRLSYEAQAENYTPDKIIEKILNTLPVP